MKLKVFATKEEIKSIAENIKTEQIVKENSLVS